MSALAVAAAGLVAGLAVHIWHVVTTRRADIVHYDAVHRDATPTRQVVAEADRTYRLWHKACQDNARLRAFAYDLLFERLIGARPRPVVRLPARSHHRLGWRDRARWFRPWPLAAITEPRP